MQLNEANDLAGKVIAGNLTAYEKLYHFMQPRLYAFCRKIIDDQEIARDIVQDVFLSLWNNRQALVIHTSLSAYIFRMTYNKCMDHLRQLKMNNKFQNYSALKIKESELLFFDPDYNAKGSIFFSEIETIISKSIDNLPDQCRKIFMMSRLDGFDHKEIASKLNISIRTVESQIYKALKSLKIELKDYYQLIIPFIWFFNLIINKL
jgi:RNA polymerase sigma-70 factor (ECF subfamily)